MPVYLKLEGDRLTCSIGGIKDKQEFADTLARVKSVTGRRYNPDTKKWEFPATAETALRLMNAVEPVVDAATQSLVRDHRSEIAEALVTGIGADASLVYTPIQKVLFPYQRAFVYWAMEHPHCILADEMGVGKTLEMIGAVHEADELALDDKGPLREADINDPVLVICPNGLRRNWRAEIIHGPRDEDGHDIYEDWPRSTVKILDGANANKRRAQLAEAADFYVVNWEKLRSDADLLAGRPWRAILADEVHRAKSRKAQQTKGLWKLNAPLMIGASGTPVMNTPDELWSVLAWLRPEQYRGPRGGGFWEFHNSYVDEFDTKYGRIMRGIKNPDDLRFELADKLARRTKAEVLPDLPDKLPPQVIEVELNASERRLYKEAEAALFLDASGVAEREAREELELPDDELLPSQVDVLRQRTTEKAEQLAAMPLARLQGLIPNGAARVAALRQITARAKAREAVELVRDNPTKPMVLFSWYVEPANWMAEQLRADHLKVGVIAGQGGDATEEANTFQRGDYDHIVCNIAKSEGFDLYRSDTAIFADRDWVPARNGQALDRLHRQGQKRAVSSIILQVPGTVDTGKVAPANRFKESIVSAVFG